jgi:hypothetical protein
MDFVLMALETTNDLALSEIAFFLTGNCLCEGDQPELAYFFIQNASFFNTVYMIA